MASSPFLTNIGSNQRAPSALLNRMSMGCAAQPVVIFAAQTEQEEADEDPLILRATYERLFANSDSLHTHRVKAFSIIDDPRPNAFVRHGSEVVITKGLLAALQQPADLAFVLAHELAHIQLEHSSSTTMGHEVAADAYALTLIQQAGFSPCGVPDLISRILVAGGRPESVSEERVRNISQRISIACATV